MHGKHVRWRGVVANAGDEGWDVDLVLRTAQEAVPFYTVFHVQIPNTLRARVHALHDGDLVEVKGRYAGEGGLLQQPRVYGDSLELISAAPTGAEGTVPVRRT